MRRRPRLVSLHLEPRERAGSARSDRLVPPADELSLRAAHAHVCERVARGLRIAVGEGGEDLPVPFARYPPAEVTRPAIECACGVTSPRLSHAPRPFRLGAASLVKDG